MEENNLSEACMKFLNSLSKEGKSYNGFRDKIKLLETVSKKGLDNITLKKIIEILMKSNLTVVNCISLINCMIPKDQIEDNEMKKLISWLFSTSASVRTLSMLIKWIVGCWEYQLINRNSIYMFYDAFFYTMLKNESLELYIAQLIYLMTKPEDVTRRQVSRLLKLNIHYRRPQNHIIALLSLFKSYKPEFVPEKIPAINIQSIWRPIPETLRTGFEGARERMILRDAQKTNEYCNWNIFHSIQIKKKQESLMPSVNYFNIGSTIFNNKIETSIFDISDVTKLGKYHSTVKLPCNATSLLANTIGYHLLTFADLEYQQRFMHNLYFTFWKSFIFENGRYSNEEMTRILDMTVEFSRYMQHGISIVTYFINEYLSCYMDEYGIKLLSLMQWSSVSIQELQDYILKHMKLMFYCSSLNTKCKIIRSFRMLLLNLFIINDNTFKNKTFPFFGQSSLGNITENVKIIEQFSRELTMAGLNIHFYNSMIISEALSFYEQIDKLEIYNKTMFTTLAPSAVIYGCFITRSCALLSRICALLLQYRKYFKEHKNRSSIINIKWLIVYVEDLVSALWYDNCFSNRLANNRYFLKSLSENAVKNNPTCDVNKLMNICQHYAVLPYMYTLNVIGLQVKTKKEANSVAAHYYNYIHQFIIALLGN